MGNHMVSRGIGEESVVAKTAGVKGFFKESTPTGQPVKGGVHKNITVPLPYGVLGIFYRITTKLLASPHPPSPLPRSPPFSPSLQVINKWSVLRSHNLPMKKLS